MPNELAAAAGAKVGKLATLQTDASSLDVNDGYAAYADPYSYEIQRRQMQMLVAAMGKHSATGEAIGAKPGKVKFTVQAAASFVLE
jgi:hypothetical protein